MKQLTAPQKLLKLSKSPEIRKYEVSKTGLTDATIERLTYIICAARTKEYSSFPNLAPIFEQIGRENDSTKVALVIDKTIAHIQGTLATRLKSYLYKLSQARECDWFPMVDRAWPKVAQIIADSFIANPIPVYCDFAQKMDWTPSAFGETANSCFWNSRNLIRDQLFGHMAIAVRYFEQSAEGMTYNARRLGGLGRTIVCPILDTGLDKLLVTNAYGAMAENTTNSTLRTAQLLAPLLDMDITHAPQLHNLGSRTALFYLNGSESYILHPKGTDIGVNPRIDANITPYNIARARRRFFTHCDHCHVEYLTSRPKGCPNCEEGQETFPQWGLYAGDAFNRHNPKLHSDVLGDSPILHPKSIYPVGTP